MKIAVAAGNGRVAKKVIAEALGRGHEVTVFGRHEENNTASKDYQKKDIFELTAEDLQKFDVVVDAAGAWGLETMYVIPKAAIYLADLVKGTDTRLIVVGGAGSLYTNKEHTSTVELSPEFPDAFKPVSAAHGLALAELLATAGVKWTYISPAAYFQADGERTGAYELHGEEFAPNSRGESIISYADYAIALVDEIEKAAHVGQRISVVRA